ncbi:MAG: glucose-1-phosphate thymidylyltransferase [Candidatus Thorarchaeota archaeon]|nr:glucose-1-phosphate thymidylyltransferase [Candidatus Thorarchaeota archaeon]
MKKAALLAAGESTRMLPLSAYRPKHLLPVAGKPMIFHILEALRNAGITEVLIIHGYHAEDLQQAVDVEEWGTLTVHYALQKERKGTAHAAGHAKEFAGDDDILLMNGDILVGPDAFSGLIRRHRSSNAEVTLSVYPIENPSAYGIVAVKDGMAVELIEKPSSDQLVSNLVNAGIYAVGRGLFDAIEETGLSKRGEYEITDSLRMLIEQGKVASYTISSWWTDIGKPWDLLDANKMLLEGEEKRISGTVEEGAVVKGNVVIEAGAIVRSGAYIEGPVFIGHNATIGPNCYLRPYSCLLEGVKVGNACEVKNSIIMERSSIGHLSYVGDSIIGQDVNFGAGTITANLRHDNKAVNVTVKGQRVSSGHRKLGAIIGDNVKTGIGTLLSTGVILHQGAKTGPGVIVTKNIGPNKLVLAKQSQEEIDYSV